MTDQEDRATTLNVYMHPDLFHRLQTRAEVEDRKVSALARLLIREGLDRRQNATP